MKISRIRVMAPLGVILLAAGVVAAEAQEQGTENPGGAECVLQVDAGTIPIQDKPVQIGLTVSSAIGPGLVAELPEESGVLVVRTRTGLGSHFSIRITLDTREGVPGPWPLVLYGEAGGCAGEVLVGGDRISVRRP